MLSILLIDLLCFVDCYFSEGLGHSENNCVKLCAINLPSQDTSRIAEIVWILNIDLKEFKQSKSIKSCLGDSFLLS